MMERQVTISLEEYLMLRDFKREMFRAFTLREVNGTADLYMELENEAIAEIFGMLEMKYRGILGNKEIIDYTNDWSLSAGNKYLFEYAKKPRIVEVVDDIDVADLEKLDLSEFEV